MSKSDKDELKSNIDSLKGELDALEEQLDFSNESLFPESGTLPFMDIPIEVYDYDEELSSIKIDCLKTLEAISNLYLDEEIMKNKNIGIIIKKDAEALADLNFSLSCSKRGLINLMKQLDSGITDPEMYEAVSTFQKEIRDSIKTLNEIKNKMKEFYKSLKSELGEINTGGNNNTKESKKQVEIDENDDEQLNLIDTKKINKIIEEMKEKNKKQ